MKGLVKITTAVIAIGMAATLAGCGGCSGCSSCSGNTNNTTVTNSNWYTGISYKGIQPSFILDDEHPEFTAEKIEYEVSFDKQSANNSSYSVDYKDGYYSTEFYATYFDWNTADFYKSDKKELVYCYKTEFRISVKYKLKSGEETDWINDSMVTESYFRPAGKSLQPVYSYQKIESTSPNKAKAKKLEDAYKSIDVSYANCYSPDCKEVTTVSAEKGKDTKTNTVSFKKVKNTLFDNAYLYIAVRSMKLTTDYSQTVSFYNAAAGGVSSYAINGTDKALGAEERKAITSELKAKNLYVAKDSKDDNGKPVEDTGVNSVAMTINYTGGNLIGTTQTIWYAAIEDSDYNTSRATMLKISIPLSYSLGTLNYTLKTVDSTLWTDKPINN